MLHPRARTMLVLSVPALLIGIFSSLILMIVTKTAEVLQHYLWTSLPSYVGLNTDSRLWIMLMLTLSGIAVGCVLRYMPGQGGPDPVSEPLIGTPVPLRALPGLILALMIGLSGGVSLGPEHPIMSVNIALAVAIGSRFLPRVPLLDWTILAAAATIGALFGTPVAAALIFSQALSGDNEIPLWDKLFAPLLASAAGALTTTFFSLPDFTLPVTHYSQMHIMDIFSGMVIVVIAIAAGMIGVWCLPRMHHLLHQLKHPVLILGVGGGILGILGTIGGKITLFKGLDEMHSLASGHFSVSALLIFALVKLAALVVASACGFRGGRIFPAVFVGAALGLMLHQYAESIPAAITLSCAILGLVLVVTRDGWLSLFMAMAVVPDIKLLPLLCIVMLPAWLLLAGKPLMILPSRQH